MNGFDLSTISSLYVGSTQHSSIYLGSTLIWPINQSLPYDAELEYLQSDGEPYINTGIYNDSNVIIDVKTSLSGKDRLSGSESSSSYRYKWGSNGSGYIYYGFGGTNYTSNTVADINTPYTFHLQQSQHYVKDSNDNIILSGSNSFSNFSTLPIILFRMSQGNSLVSLNGTGNTRIYYCNIQTPTTNLQLIPVRVGNVGYLYDKVSKRLFGNSGSGNFILGPEVSPIKSDNQLPSDLLIYKD